MQLRPSSSSKRKLMSSSKIENGASVFHGRALQRVQNKCSTGVPVTLATMTISFGFWPSPPTPLHLFSGSKQRPPSSLSAMHLGTPLQLFYFLRLPPLTAPTPPAPVPSTNSKTTLTNKNKNKNKNNNNNNNNNNNRFQTKTTIVVVSDASATSFFSGSRQRPPSSLSAMHLGGRR